MVRRPPRSTRTDPLVPYPTLFRSLSAGQRRDRRLDPLDRAGMVGAPDVDQFVGRLRLLEMIGEVGAEIGPASVRLPDRAILVVAEAGRSEQRQFHRLPIVGRFALRRL